MSPHPGEPHEFRTVCQRCGELGFLHVSVITDQEVVTISDRAAPDAAPLDAGLALIAAEQEASHE